MSAFFEQDRRDVTVEDVAKALTLALDLTQREVLPVHVRLEYSTNFGAWLEWLLCDELTHSRLLREFDERTLSGVSSATRERALESGLIPSETYSSDIGQVTLRLWSVVTASLVHEASKADSSVILMSFLLKEAIKVAKNGLAFEEVIKELKRLAARWRAAAWLNDLFPIHELVVLGGNGSVPDRILRDLPPREDR